MGEVTIKVKLDDKLTYPIDSWVVKEGGPYYCLPYASEQPLLMSKEECKYFPWKAGWIPFVEEKRTKKNVTYKIDMKNAFGVKSA